MKRLVIRTTGMLRCLLSLLIILTVTAELYAAPVSVRILHFNDFHGFANPVRQKNGSTLGGAARLAEAISRQRDVPGLLLAAGDSIQGDPWANLFQGSSSLELMNLLKVDAMVLGNHEFDFGQKQLSLLIAAARFPVLGANIAGMPEVQPKTSFVRNGVRISVIGLTTDDTPKSSHPRNTAGLTFLPPLEVAKRQIAESTPHSDLIVLLTHIGYDQDQALAKEICGKGRGRSVPVLIAGGHTHTKAEHPFRIGNCTVVQAWEHGKALGVVDYTFEGDGQYSVKGRLVEIGPGFGAGVPEVAALVERYNREADAVLGKSVGSVAVDLVQQGVRSRETSLGNLVADLVRKTTGAEAAIINGGSLRSGLPAGKITARQVYTALPFDNYLVAVRMSGRELLETLEHGVSAVEHEEGRFPQVSGIRFSYRRDRPAGSRVLGATVNGVKINPMREYTVATLDFMAAGGDGYVAFGRAIRAAGDFSDAGGALVSSRLVYNDPGRYLRDIFIDTARRNSPLSSRIEGRVIEVR